jgi:hypothetical protein
VKNKLYILILLSCFSLLGNSQEIRFGGVYGINTLQRTVLDTSIYSPANSYYTYIESNTGAGLIDKVGVLNAFHLGTILSVSYRRFTFNIEPQFYYQRSTVKFEKPYETERVFGKKAFRMPTYLTYKFFKKEKSIYFLLGVNPNFEKNWDFQNPKLSYYIGDGSLYQNGVDFGDDHFKGILYDDKPYANFVVGLGRIFGKLNTSLRFQRPFKNTSRQLTVNSWQLELSFNILFLSTKDFTKKHFLYVD